VLLYQVNHGLHFALVEVKLLFVEGRPIEVRASTEVCLKVSQTAHVLGAARASQHRQGALDSSYCDLVHRNLKLNGAETAREESDLALFLHRLEPLLKFQVRAVNELRPERFSSLVSLHVLK